MAPPAGTLRVGRYFLALVLLFLVLGAIVFWPSATHSPKLGLDLRGGAQIVYKAQTTNGKAPSSGSMNQAKSIIDQRVNGLGVEQSQVVIQGSDEIVVTVPGKRADQLTDVGRTALLNFRPLIAGPFTVVAPTPVASTSAGASSSASVTGSVSAPATVAPTGSSTAKASDSSSAPVSGQNFSAKKLAAAVSSSAPASATSTPPASSTPTVTGSATGSAATSATPTPTLTADPTTVGFDDLTDAQKLEVQNFNDCSAPKTDAQKNLLACDDTGAVKYLLGPVLVPGTQVSSASAQAPSATSGQFQWAVVLSLKSSGDSIWAKYTAAHHNADSTGQTTDTVAANYVDFTLDDQVISNTNIQSAIPIGSTTQVTGQFTQDQATKLANSLKYGALPLKFSEESRSTVSATLGSAQLKAGLLAGGIGLILVVIYSLIYYRALGLVTIASLLVSGGLTYGSLVVLGSQIGFTLTLAGIAGFIVAVGITADSFVVLFERIKDEVHEGRTMRVAVPRAWIRARRTIISADVVSFLAAFVLYLFAAGDVRGFAFTLGMSTILDLVVVFLFTHPLVSLLSRSAAFGSARFTGLDSARVGGVAQSAPTTEARRRASAKRRAASVAARAAGGASGTATSVLDDEDLDDGQFDDEQLDDASGGDLVGVDWTEDDLADDGVAGSDPAPEADDNDRIRTTPAAGTAAERAAARRAKMREEGKL